MRLCLVATVIFALAAQVAAQTTVTTVDLDNLHPKARGLSGLEIVGGGSGFVALSDYGDVLTGTLQRQRGEVTSATITKWARLLNPQGNPLLQSQEDAEGLAVNDRGLWVSFEGSHTVWQYATPFSRATPMPRATAFQTLPLNGSLEAMAIAPNGDLYTIPEVAVADGAFPVFRYRAGQWKTPFHLPKTDGFLVVGADIGPDGALYVLERRFWLFRFASRIRKVALDGTHIETAWQSDLGDFDNLEGLSVWHDNTGKMRFTMVSDNNDKSFQTTQLVEVTLTP